MGWALMIASKLAPTGFTLFATGSCTRPPNLFATPLRERIQSRNP